jgi:hypothetical protein
VFERTCCDVRHRGIKIVNNFALGRDGIRDGRDTQLINVAEGAKAELSRENRRRAKTIGRFCTMHGT